LGEQGEVGILLELHDEMSANQPKVTFIDDGGARSDDRTDFANQLPRALTGRRDGKPSHQLVTCCPHKARVGEAHSSSAGEELRAILLVVCTEDAFVATRLPSSEKYKHHVPGA